MDRAVLDCLLKGVKSWVDCSAPFEVNVELNWGIFGHFSEDVSPKEHSTLIQFYVTSEYAASWDAPSKGMPHVWSSFFAPIPWRAYLMQGAPY